MKLVRNKKITLTIFSLLLILTPLLVLADANGWGMPGIGSYPGVTENFNDAVIKATNWLLGFTAMVAVLVIIWGGISYVGSTGDEEKARTSKKTITYGLLGLLVAGLAYATVKVIVETIL